MNFVIESNIPIPKRDTRRRYKLSMSPVSKQVMTAVHTMTETTPARFTEIKDANTFVMIATRRGYRMTQRKTNGSGWLVWKVGKLNGDKL